MFDFMVHDTSEKEPSANVLFYNGFVSWITSTVDQPRIFVKNPDAPPKLQNVSISDFCENPLGIKISFNDRAAAPQPRYVFKSPIPEDFPGCRPHIAISFPKSTTGDLLRSHLWQTLYVNNCFIGQDHPVHLRHCATREDVPGKFPVIVDQHKTAFWDVRVVDFKGKPSRQGNDAGCTLPDNVAKELIGWDLLFKTSVAQALVGKRTVAGVAAQRQSNVAVVRGLNPQRAVRFSNKDDVVIVRAHETARGSATTDPKPTRPEKEDPQKESDTTTLAYIAAALLGFAGLFYYTGSKN